MSVYQKHHNRSWAVHECLSETLQRLFYEKEIDTLFFDEEFEQLIKSVKDKTSCKHLISNPTFVSYIEKYNAVQHQYLNGDKGKTAQFIWSIWNSSSCYTNSITQLIWVISLWDWIAGRSLLHCVSPQRRETMHDMGRITLC